LGTTNSAVSIVRDGKAEVLRDPRGQAILPSVVGLDSSGALLVGEEARNQALVAPERTVRSVKRSMGQDTKIRLGEGEYAPQEISAMILRTLARQAERAYGVRLDKAVITVPAFFNDIQREATREAGSLAGLDVLRIINEPTAASLVYEPHSERNEKLMVYDLGGGTFDVSIVQVEAGVIEVLASHGDTHLGGDDFDQLLLNYVANAFQEEHKIDLREVPVAKSRLLRAVEDAKKRLSTEAYTTIAAEFITEQQGRPLNLNMTIDRSDYESLIAPLLRKTLDSVDAALEAAKLTAQQIDRVLLVGGSTRTPMVHRLLTDQLHRELHQEIDPDLCVSLGAAVQGALVAGIDVGPVLVDITPHTLGIQCRGRLFGVPSSEVFSPIITRNSPLPAMRSQIYYTTYEGQDTAEIHVLQGESEIARLNQSVGRFWLEGLNQEADEGNEILVRFELNLDGILKVTAQERETGLAKEITIDNAVTRFRAKGRTEAKERLAAMFSEKSPSPSDEGATGLITEGEEGSGEPTLDAARKTLAQARRLVPQAPPEDANEMRDLIDQLSRFIQAGDSDGAKATAEQLDDLLFYLQGT
jgi:molecular chaperone DnaK